MVRTEAMKKKRTGPLARYLADTATPIGEFANTIGVTHPTVIRYCQGRIPEPELMRKIALATGMRVTPNDWLGIVTEQVSAA